MRVPITMAAAGLVWHLDILAATPMIIEPFTNMSARSPSIIGRFAWVVLAPEDQLCAARFSLFHRERNRIIVGE